MTASRSTRRRFLAALALYLAWVGTLAAMAITSSNRPPASLLPAETDAAPGPTAEMP